MIYRQAGPAHAGVSGSLTPATIGWLTAIGIGLSLGMLALGGFVVIEARRDAWQQAETASENLLIALEQDIGRNLMLINLSMQGVIEALAQPDINTTSPAVRRQAIFDRAISAQDLGAMLVSDAEGNIVEDSTSVIPHAVSIAQRDQFRAHQERPDIGLYVSRPFRGMLNTNELNIALSRRMPSEDGHFVGVVTAALRLTYFTRLFERLTVGNSGSISLMRTDGRLLVRSPFKEADVGRDLTGSEIFQRYATEASGRFVGTGSIDGVRRLYTFRHIRDFPLLLSVNVSVDEILASWRKRASFIGVILLVLTAATTALCLLFRRELIGRAAAERALEHSARELTRMAMTDGLTKVYNRRKFEAMFDVEWRAAMGQGHPLGLLMLDIDYFKRYNDLYGHPAGDRVLRSIAGSIKACTRNALDTCARYGGEEFVVILPNSDAATTQRVAERICMAVSALSVVHAGSPMGRVTISVGMAVGWPGADKGPNILRETADAALYAAKNAGRNRVEAASDNLLPDTLRMAPATVA